jgi:hypothetical protein
MDINTNIYMYRSGKAPELSCFSRGAKGEGLPEKLAPWTAYGVLRADQTPPHKLSRKAIETGIDENGYQLYRSRTKAGTPSRKE